MRYFNRYRSFAIAVLFILCMFFFSTCISNENDKNTTIENTSLNYSDFAGSKSCASCHKNIYEDHIRTAHFHTSEIATENSIKGSFEPGKNAYTYRTGGTVRMEKRNDTLYQVGYVSSGMEKIRQHFDIITGSGTKGQTYLSWVGSNLYQLPVSYFTTAGAWCNSPGLPNKIVFFRPITSRCLECHSTYVTKISEEKAEPELFDKNKIIWGVDCEKCHGPAAKHVTFQTENPQVKTARYILNPSRFSRQQSLDLCALCHGGRMQKKTASFEFTAGKNLADYFLIDTVEKNVNSIDVHGNQYGLLKASKCFKNSKTMTCITCHSPHANEQGKTETFSQRCITCHNDKHKDAVLCKMSSTLGDAINTNCTNCHMPQLSSRAIAVLLQGNDTLTPAKMHTHLIKDYPEATRKILALFATKHDQQTKQGAKINLNKK